MPRMNLNEYNYMSAALEFFAAVVALVMLVGCLLERKKNAKTSRLFAWCLVCHAAMLLVDAPIWLFLINPSPEKVIPIKILSFFSDMFLISFAITRNPFPTVPALAASIEELNERILMFCDSLYISLSELCNDS